VDALACATTEVDASLVPPLPSSTFGQRVLVPSFLKNDPIKVFGNALAPPHSEFKTCVKASRNAIHVVEQERLFNSDAVHPESGVL